MKQFLLTMVIGFALLNTQAQNEKNLVVDANAEVRSISSFTAIEVSGTIDMYISQGSEEAVAVSATSDEVRTRIKTEVKNNTLYIYLDAKGFNWKKWGNHKMKAYVTYKTLERLEASGACNVKSTDPIKQTDLRMEFSGASDFSGEITVTKLRLSTSGASEIKLTGKADNISIDANGACSVKAYDLVTDMCKISATGASNIRITVNKELNAIATGGSTIYYKGTGLIRGISSNGGAAIKHKTDD